jgi:hypothetical protein
MSAWQPPLMKAGEEYAAICKSADDRNEGEHDTLSYALSELVSSLHYAGFDHDRIRNALRRASETHWAN